MHILAELPGGEISFVDTYYPLATIESRCGFSTERLQKAIERLEFDDRIEVIRVYHGTGDNDSLESMDAYKIRK